MRIRDPGWRQFGSGIRDGKKSDPGSGTNIPDPQHWAQYARGALFKGRNIQEFSVGDTSTLHQNKYELNLILLSLRLS